MNKRILYFAVILSVIMASCKKDYLETNPTDQVSGGLVLNSTANINAALNGIYRYMFERTSATTSNTQNKPGVTGILLGVDFMGEDIGISTANWYAATGEGDWTGARNDNAPMTLYYYRTFYRIVTNTNYILNAIDNATGTDADKAKLKAEALTLRAYAYSYLVQFYGKRYDASLSPNTQPGVPLVLKVTDERMPRASVEEVYNAINADLDEAIALFPAASDMSKRHVNVWVAKGLKARVALTMQNYDVAIKQANDVIASGRYALLDSVKYRTGFNDAVNLSEFMWAAMPTVDQNDAFGSYFAQIAYNANSSFMRGNPKRINSLLYDKITSTDVRKTLWVPNPSADNFPLPSQSFARQPYMSRKFSIKGGITSLGDFPFMRSAEMYLILAEAYASKHQDADAQRALFALVSVRDKSAKISSNVGSDLMDEILTNRRVELWAEGFRWLDLKRLNLPLDRTVVPNYVGASVNNFMQVPAGDPSWQFLIPISEIQANPSLVGQQNQ